MKAELVPINGDPPIPITRDVTVIGRRDGCDIVIGHLPLSKRHCVLVRTDGLLIIRDLATTNGTKVNGQRIRWAALLPRDKISLAGYKMRVYLGADDAQSPSEQRAVDQMRLSGSGVDLFPTPTPETSPPDLEEHPEDQAAEVADFFDESSAELEIPPPRPRDPRPPRTEAGPIAADFQLPATPPKNTRADEDRPFFIKVDES